MSKEYLVNPLLKKNGTFLKILIHNKFLNYGFSLFKIE